MSINLVEGPQGLMREEPQGGLSSWIQGVFTQRSPALSYPITAEQSLSKDLLAIIYTLNKLAEENLKSPCQIASFDTTNGKVKVTTLSPAGHSKELTFKLKDVLERLPSKKDLNVSFLPATTLYAPSYLDGLSLAASHYYKNHPIPPSKL